MEQILHYSSRRVEAVGLTHPADSKAENKKPVGENLFFAFAEILSPDSLNILLRSYGFDVRL